MLKDWAGNNRLERIWLLAKIEFNLRYYENKLGLIWALFKPLILMAIYYVAFAILMGIKLDHYAVYLFGGIIIWGFFTESSTGMIVLLQTKRYLYEYTNMSKMDIYLSGLISISIGFAFNLFIFLLAVLFDGLSLGWHLLWYPLIFVVMFVFSIGTTLILSTLFLVAKDVKQIWPLLIQFLFWVSPILYHYDNIESKAPFLNYINPMAGIIINSRNTLMYNLPPIYDLLFLNILQAVIVLLIGLIMLKKFGPRASEML